MHLTGPDRPHLGQPWKASLAAARARGRGSWDEYQRLIEAAAAQDKEAAKVMFAHKHVTADRYRQTVGQDGAIVR